MAAATPKATIVNDIHVEQIDADVKPPKSNPERHKHSERDRNRLTLPETDFDESSESSSMLSPHSDEHPDLESTSDDESIAVNCHTNPSEVIVKGKNVKQIRVKFPPHPPNLEEFSRKKSGRYRLRRTASGNSIKDDDENVPYSQEETSLPAISETHVDQSMIASFPHLNPSNSSASIHSQEASGYNSNQFSMSNRSAHASSVVDWDLKFRQDVLSGIDYFDKKASNFKDLYNQNQRLLEVLKMQNRDLEEQVKKLHNDNKHLWEETDELKIKLDASEKENIILQDQAMSEWQSRVKSEEMYVELKCDSDKEIAALKEKLSEKSKVGKSLHNADLRMGVGVDKVDGAYQGKERTKGVLSEDQFELMHTISRLQDDIRKLNREKETVADNNGRLRQDVADAKSAFREKGQELASQHKRFLSLKKSFNDLSEENDKLKMQLRGRGAVQHHATREQIMNALGNSTWPAGNAAAKANGEVESVSYIDLPKGSLAAVATNGSSGFKGTSSVAHQSTNLKVRRGSIGPRVVNGAGGSIQHKRAKSDVICLTENLPPVANPSR